MGLLLVDDEVEFDDVDADEVEPQRDVDGTGSASATSVSSSISGSIHARKLVLLLTVQHYWKNLSLTLQHS